MTEQQIQCFRWRAAFAPKGERLKRLAELRAARHEQLRAEVERAEEAKEWGA